MAVMQATKRDGILNPRQVRALGQVPATIYGKGTDSISIQLDAKEFILTYRKDKNAIFELKTGKETHKAIVKKVQSEAVSDKVLNVEFQKVIADQKVRLRVLFEMSGDSAAVKAGGKLIKNLSSIEVECLPQDIPQTIKVDISKLAEYGTTLSVGQIEFPEGVRPLGSLENIVVKVAAPKAAKGK